MYVLTGCPHFVLINPGFILLDPMTVLRTPRVVNFTPETRIKKLIANYIFTMGVVLHTRQRIQVCLPPLMTRWGGVRIQRGDKIRCAPSRGASRDMSYVRVRIYTEYAHQF